MFSVSGPIESVKRETKVTDEQLDRRVEETDFPHLAPHFDNATDYVEMLGLTPAEQVNVKRIVEMYGNAAAIKRTLKHWLERVLAEGTFRALLLILLSLDKGDIAIKVAQYLSDKGEYI